MVRRAVVALIVLPMLMFIAVPVLAAPPASAGGFCHEPVIENSNVPVDAKGACFFPSVVHVPVGADVTFRNSDDIDHTVTGQGAAWGGDLPAGQTLKVHFDRPGVFPYFCHIHIGMIGAVVVTGSASAVVAPKSSNVASAASARSRINMAGLAASRSTHRGSDNGPMLLAAMGLVVLVALAAAARRRRRAASSS